MINHIEGSVRIPKGLIMFIEYYHLCKDNLCVFRLVKLKHYVGQVRGNRQRRIRYNWVFKCAFVSRVSLGKADFKRIDHKIVFLQRNI